MNTIAFRFFIEKFDYYNDKNFASSFQNNFQGKIVSLAKRKEKK